MKVILLSDVAKVGKKYDVKDISSGFARNLLIPKGLAKPATSEALRAVENLRKQKDAEAKLRNELLHQSLSSLYGKTITMVKKATGDGHLFGGIGADDIVALVKEKERIELLPDFIVLEKAIKTTGEHKIPVRVGDMKGEFTLRISKESD